MRRQKKTIEDHITRVIGSRAFVVAQTLLFGAWTAWNVLAPEHLQFDHYPFVFLNLFMSAEAAYATSIILMSSSKQEQVDHNMLRETHRDAEVGKKQNEQIIRMLTNLSS